MKTSWRASASSAKRSFRRSARAGAALLSGKSRARGQAALAEHPLFATCTRPELRQILRWGDEVEVEDGEVLLRHHRAGRWFLAVLSGSLSLVRDGRTVGHVGPGDHLGATTILGLGPQGETVVAHGRCRLFVMGAQPLISVAHGVPGFRRALFGTEDAETFLAEVRRLRAEGDAAWRRLSPAVVEEARSEPEHLVWRPPRVRRTGVDWATVLVPDRLRSLPRPGGIPVPPRALVLAGGFGLVLALVVALLFWHPPRAVLSPGDPVDAAADVSVEGVRTFPLHGRYLITPVDVDRPALGGFMLATLRGRRSVALGDGRGAELERRAARRAFADSRRAAVTAAARAAGVDADQVNVRFDRQPLVGPSAGLVYALAVADLVSPADYARGRVVAATGELGRRGRVLPVGNLAEKLDVAEEAGADLLLVPEGQHPGPGATDVPVHEVSSVKEALEVLLAT